MSERHGIAELLQLTPLEWEVMEHRLDVEDCLIDALCDDDDGFDRDDTAAVIELLQQGEWEQALDVEPDIAVEVLCDCVNGSTFFGCAEHNVSEQKLNAIIKAGESLADKVEAWSGKSCVFPCH